MVVAVMVIVCGRHGCGRHGCGIITNVLLLTYLLNVSAQFHNNHTCSFQEITTTVTNKQTNTTGHNISWLR